MDFAITYLLQRFFYRIFDFFHHWYIDGSRAIGRRFMTSLASADQSFALSITIRHFFEPLYKDYSVIGRILGVIFRTFRVLIGLAFYVLLSIVFVIIYIFWAAVPVFIIYYAARTF